MPQRLTASANSFTLLAAPFFMLSGMAMNTAGVTHRIYDFAECLAGWLRGGLAHVNIVGSVIFAGMSGSAVADAAGLGTIEIKAMADEGYPKEFAAAVTAASATIGPIIPPSVPLLFYGVVADASIGRLFLGGVIPGLLMAGALMVMVAWMSRRRGLPAAPVPRAPGRGAADAAGGALPPDPGHPLRRDAERRVHARRRRPSWPPPTRSSSGSCSTASSSGGTCRSSSSRPSRRTP